MKVEIMQDVMANNHSYAVENRQTLKNHKIFTVNLLGSPGAGKTSALEQIFTVLQGKIRAAVIEGDLATAKDAARISTCGVPVVQINTNGGCHLDAKMIAQVLPGFALDELDMMIIENVGNLVCPAAFDLGEDLKVVVLSIAEGGDKPLKYPNTFVTAAAVILNKVDLLPYSDVDIEAMQRDLLTINPQLQIFRLCCRTGFVQGVEEIVAWLEAGIEQKKNQIQAEDC